MSNYQKLIEYINKDERLVKINARRSRNFVLYKNDLMSINYDIQKDELNFGSSIPFSDIKYDTNRKFTEQICIDLLLDFKKTKDKMIGLLNKPYDRSYKESYVKYIDILNGDATATEDDVLVMISILGRLNQEHQMGPISVLIPHKLNPDLVKHHHTIKDYIRLCVSTIKAYTKLYITNKGDMQLLGNVGFNRKLDRIRLNPSEIRLLSYENLYDIDHCQAETVKEKLLIHPFKTGSHPFEPNHIESFFKKIVELSTFADIPVTIDNYQDIASDLASFAGRFKVNRLPDFVILAKMKGIFVYVEFKYIIKAIRLFVVNQKAQTYYQKIAHHVLLLKSLKEQKYFFYELLATYEKHIASEITRYLSAKIDNLSLTYNDSEITIVSDMHFNSMKDINYANFSKHFNIIAGDFYNNTYHRGGAAINETSDIVGIGVIGNHDVNWSDSVADLKKEVKTRYKQSIINLNKVFPNVKILNNEVYYKNGIAFVGLTMVTDETVVQSVFTRRTFFANEMLGAMFEQENYLETAKSLLDSVDKNIPIVLITHAPFKEYAVCKNKKIGIFSNRLLIDYPNIKLYIHGHGHSYQQSKLIDGVMCITNPIVNNIYADSVYNIKWSDIH